MSFWRRLTGRAPRPVAEARRLYDAVVAQARLPGFYRGSGVPDTLDGRFELVALHSYLLLRRLKREAQSADLAQAVFDAMFTDMDESLREIGVGDLSVGRRVKQMAQAFYGRIAAYDAGLAEAGDAALEAALARNLYGTLPEAPPATAAMARYMRQAAAELERLDGATLRAGTLRFPAPPFD